MAWSSASVFELTGWLVLGGLAMLFVVQSRSLRAFTRPKLSERDSWPSLSILVTGEAPDSEIRRVVSELRRTAYQGEVEIFLATGEPGRDLASQLAIASTRVPVTAFHAHGDDPIGTFVRDTLSDLVLLTSVTTRLEEDAIPRLVSELLDEDEPALALLPRLELGWSEIFVDPMIHWLRLTLPSLFGPAATQLGPLLVRKGHLFDRPARCVDGYDAASRTSLSLRDARRELAASTTRRVAAAAALVLLFTLPIVAALVMQSFPWMIAAVASYWSRFRVAARTGEPFPASLLHPALALLLAIVLPAETPSAIERT